MKNIIFIFSVVISFILIGCSNEDSPIVPSYEGVVINSITNQPFEGISVSVTNGSNTKLSTTTNTQGEFKFSLNTEGLSGEYYIQVGNANTEKKQIQITGIGKTENNLGIIKITPDSKPESKITDLLFQNNNIILKGAILNSGFSNITSVGFYISKEEKVTSESIRIYAILDGSEFTATYEEDKLNIDSEYYIFPFAMNDSGENIGQYRKFKTDTYTPELSWGALNFSSYSATCQAEVTNNGGSDIVECGFCWSTDGHPDITSSHQSLSHTTINVYYSLTITDLRPSTLYYVRPYAKNKRGGIGYGQLLTFTTEKGLPRVYTANALPSRNTIIMSGEVTNNGGAKITRQGFCYGGSPYPTLDDYIVDVPITTTTFNATASDIVDGARYYVRAFAENENGISYGSDKEVVTYVLAHFKVVDQQNKPLPSATLVIDYEKTQCDENGEKYLYMEPASYRIWAIYGDKISQHQDYVISHYKKEYTLIIRDSE